MLEHEAWMYGTVDIIYTYYLWVWYGRYLGPGAARGHFEGAKNIGGSTDFKDTVGISIRFL